MAPFRAGRGGAGFTLLELLVAMTVLSFLIGGLYLSIGTSSTHAHRIGVRLRSRQAVRIAMQRMAADLGGVQWGAGKSHLYFEGKRDSGIGGGRDRLEFTAVRYRWKEAGEKADELVSIAYSLRTVGKTANLLREERPLLGGSRRAASVPILTGVEALSFAYLDRENAVRESWDTRAGGEGEAALPAAVRISIKIRIEDSDQVYSTLVAVPLGLYDAGKLADETGVQEQGSGESADQGGGEAGAQEQGGGESPGQGGGSAGPGQ